VACRVEDAFRRRFTGLQPESAVFVGLTLSQLRRRAVAGGVKRDGRPGDRAARTLDGADKFRSQRGIVCQGNDSYSDKRSKASVDELVFQGLRQVDLGGERRGFGYSWRSGRTAVRMRRDVGFMGRQVS
jgi:hypothetical protein